MSQLDLVTSQAPVITHVMDICHFSDDDSLVTSRNTTKFNVRMPEMLYFSYEVFFIWYYQALSNILKACIRSISDEYFIYTTPVSLRLSIHQVSLDQHDQVTVECPWVSAGCPPSDQASTVTKLSILGPCPIFVWETLKLKGHSTTFDGQHLIGYSTDWTVCPWDRWDWPLYMDMVVYISPEQITWTLK